MGDRGGFVILESIVAIDENETEAATVHHFFSSEPTTAADSSALAFTGTEDEYLGRATGNVLVDVGSFSTSTTTFNGNSTVVLKLKNGSTGFYVVTETLGSPNYASGKTKFRYIFREQ